MFEIDGRILCEPRVRISVVLGDGVAAVQVHHGAHCRGAADSKQTAVREAARVVQLALEDMTRGRALRHRTHNCTRDRQARNTQGHIYRETHTEIEKPTYHAGFA
jgi:hypothetical protein